jgi:prophage antirepressor-like protein
MDGLINLYENRKRMKIVLDGKDHFVKLQGTTDEPYFCGKDVCAILGYVDIKKALQVHIKSKHKRELKEFEMVDDKTPSTSDSQNPVKIGETYTQLSYNDGKAVYISEAGLYSAIMHSRAAFAEKFQDLVYETILPSIRKYGQFQLNQQLKRANEQLVVKETISNQLTRENETISKQLAAKDVEIELEKKKAIHFKKMADRQKAREKNHVVYVATTKTYALNNRFKIGGVKSMSLLKGRLSTYNSGRPVGDKMYYAHIVSCVNYVHLEAKIKEVLGAHREVEDAEVYNLHYNDVKFFVDFLSTRYNEEIDLHDEKLDQLVSNVLNLKPVVPEPIVLNGAELRSVINGRPSSTVKVDFDAMDEIEQNEWLKRVLQEVKDSESGDTITIERRSLFDEMDAAKFNKTRMWSRLKPIANDLRVVMKY